MIQRKKVTLKYIEATKNRQKKQIPHQICGQHKKDSKQTGTCIVFRKVDVFHLLVFFSCFCVSVQQRPPCEPGGKANLLVVQIHCQSWEYLGRSPS